MITLRSLSRAAGIRHGFHTREGGYSTGLYRGLNCGLGSGDDTATVVRNRAKVESDLGLAAGRLVSLFQCHSAETVTVREPWQSAESPEADSMVTNRPGIGLGILTADCVPVLFADPDARIIGAAHAGWKGAVGGVLESTVDAMAALGSRRDRIIACIGPCIRQPSYEVGADLRETFVSRDDRNIRFFGTGKRAGHYQFDLAGYVGDRLRGCDLGHVDDVKLDTYSDSRAFYSYRRMTHRNEPDYGRQISIIALDDG